MTLKSLAESSFCRLFPASGPNPAIQTPSLVIGNTLPTAIADFSGSTKSRTLLPLIQSKVTPGSAVYTDELPSYRKLDKLGYDHKYVCHKARQYVDGDVHTNGLEGFWSRIKLSIRGTHVWVSEKHLEKYAGEFAFRYNRRKRQGQMFDEILENLLEGQE